MMHPVDGFPWNSAAWRIAAPFLCAVIALGCGKEAKQQPTAAEPRGPAAPPSSTPAEATSATLGDIVRLPGKVTNETRPDVSLRGSTALVVWANVKAGTLTAQQITGVDAKPHVVPAVTVPHAQASAVAAIAAAHPTVAFVEKDGVRVVDVSSESTSTVTTIPGHFTAIDAITLRDGTIAIALLGGGTASVDTVSNGGKGLHEVLFDASANARDTTSISIVPRDDGYALSYPAADGTLTIASAPSATATPTLHALPVAHGAARIGVGSDRTLHVLYGGDTVKGASIGSGEIGYSWQQAGKRWAHHPTERDLQCDHTGFLIGVAPFAKPALLYGYGCDVGWGVASVRGKEISPKRLTDDIGRKGFVPSSSSSTPTRVALAGVVTLRGQIGVQFLTP
jgi:hypothetical protein